MKIVINIKLLPIGVNETGLTGSWPTLFGVCVDKVAD